MAPKKQLKPPSPIIQPNSDDIFSDIELEEETHQTVQFGRVTKYRKRWRDSELILPANVFYRKLIDGKFAQNIRKDAAVYLTGVLEYLCCELLDIAHECTVANKKKRIIPRFIMMAIKNDEEFDKLLQHVTIPQSGVVPHIHNTLLFKPTLNIQKGSSNRVKPSGVSQQKKPLLPTMESDSD